MSNYTPVNNHIGFTRQFYNAYSIMVRNPYITVKIKGNHLIGNYSHYNHHEDTRSYNINHSCVVVVGDNHHKTRRMINVDSSTHHKIYYADFMSHANTSRSNEYIVKVA